MITTIIIILHSSILPSMVILSWIGGYTCICILPMSVFGNNNLLKHHFHCHQWHQCQSQVKICGIITILILKRRWGARHRWPTLITIIIIVIVVIIIIIILIIIIRCGARHPWPTMITDTLVLGWLLQSWHRSLFFSFAELNILIKLRNCFVFVIMRRKKRRWKTGEIPRRKCSAASALPCIRPS